MRKDRLWNILRTLSVRLRRGLGVEDGRIVGMNEPGLPRRGWLFQASRQVHQTIFSLNATQP